MEPERVSPIEGVLNFISALSSYTGYDKDRYSDEVCGSMVDTVVAKDTGKWETGIERPVDSHDGVIVEQYQDRDAALEGHKKWVELLTNNPDAELKDIDLWNLDSYYEEGDNL